MGLIKLIINECIKIFKKRSIIIFLTLSVISFFISYGIVSIEKNSKSKYTYIDNSIEIMQLELDKLKNEFKTATEDKQISLNFKIQTYEYAIKNNIQIHSVNASYKANLIMQILAEEELLSSIDKNIMKDEYINQIYKIDRIQKILDDNSFEDYITYNKEKIEKDYNDKIITKDEYNTKIEEQNLALKYEIDKYPIVSDAVSWKKELLSENAKIVKTIESGYNYDKKEYLTIDGIRKLQEQKIINTYRLDNNMAPNNVINSEDNSNSYYRWSYDYFAIPLSMFFVSLLFIVLATSSISEETSKGTIKFLLITPFKRYKILLAKLISYILILIIITFILSQINVLLGNIFFSNISNDYLYVDNNRVEIMNTNLYVTLQYLLKLPEILIYILLGITLSTLTRNTAVANTFTVTTYIGVPTAIYVIQQFIKLDFFKYLPFNNFDLRSKLLPFDTYNNTFSINNSYNTTLEFSLLVLCITVFLLLVTMFESFNKRDII
jgi:ABC-2 type transport system permease protein